MAHPRRPRHLPAGESRRLEYQAHLRAGLRASLGVEFTDVDVNGQADIVGIDNEVLVEFSTRGVDIETEVEVWAAEFFEREGRPPSPVEVGKAHKTITLATRDAKPADAGLPTATLRDRWRARADGLVDVDELLARVLSNRPTPMTVVRPSIEDVLLAVETKCAEWSEPVFGVGPSATAARQLEAGAGTEADTMHKLVHEHTNNRLPGAKWDLPVGSVVIIDEAAMVDTRLLHQYSQLAGDPSERSAPHLRNLR